MFHVKHFKGSFLQKNVSRETLLKVKMHFDIESVI